MLITGLCILAFFGLHFYDFWIHEMNYKYIQAMPEDPSRYWTELHAKFADLWRVILYVVAFILLGLHLAHGFQSSFQSIGARHPKYTPFIKGFGTWFSILVPVAFIAIAIFHFVTQ
jgi:succinate dehydrogenase / fumarate reductase cytochrome b subunit